MATFKQRVVYSSLLDKLDELQIMKIRVGYEDGLLRFVTENQLIEFAIEKNKSKYGEITNLDTETLKKYLETITPLIEKQELYINNWTDKLYEGKGVIAKVGITARMIFDKKMLKTAKSIAKIKQRTLRELLN
jgi:hypothetical protein